MRIQWRLILLLITLLLGFSLNKNPFRPPNIRSNPPPVPQKIKLESWQRRLGKQIITLRRAIPTANRVVLVPDTATFLTAIQQWNLQERYPILIEDERYTPLFLNQFQPQEIIRLPAANPMLVQERKIAMQKAVAAAWESNETSLKKTWQELGWNPPGVVLTSAYDPASVAAVALAADRGQPLLFLDGYFGEVNQTLSSRSWQHLNQEVNESVKSTGYDYQELGDTLDTITLVRALPVKYRNPKNQDILAVTDGLGRHETGERYAIAGWIYGSPERAVYQAMSAIFLDKNSALLYDSYPKTDSWKSYHFEEYSIQRLKKMGLQVTHIEHPEASGKTWQKITAQPWNYDLIFINSRGGKANFAVGNGDAFVEDIPQLNTPTAIHIIHSFSATTPADIDTIAGRWLDYGAYAYVGSVDEPYVTAFVPPQAVLARLSLQVPFLIASRYVDSPPWKITTIGDPLMVIGN